MVQPAMTFRARRIRNLAVTAFIGGVLWTVHEAVDAALYDASFFSGWLLLAVVVFLTLYRTRKAVSVLSLGSAANWMQLHLYLGALSIFLFAVHLDWRIPNGIVDMTIALTFSGVALSGIGGLTLVRTIPQRLTDRGEEVILERIPVLIADLRRSAEALVVESAARTRSSTLSDFYFEHVHEFFCAPKNSLHHMVASNRPLIRLLTEWSNVNRYLDANEREYAERLRELILKKDDLDFHHALQTALKIWLLVHVPLTFGLLILSVAHLVVVYAFSGGA